LALEMLAVRAASQHAPVRARWPGGEARATQGGSDQPGLRGWRATGVRGVDRRGVAAQVPENPVNERRLLDAGDDDKEIV